MLSELSHGAPRWLLDELGRSWHPELIDDLRDLSGFDHLRTYKGRVVISQPYEATEKIGTVLALLAGHGIRVRIWGISPYFPERTFSLVIWREEDEALASEIMDRMQKPFEAVAPKQPSHKEWA